jgi:MATE family multidrug resistance protein
MIYQIGVAIGAGRQKYVAYIDLGCYYLVGLPLGFLLGFVYQLGVQVSCVHFFISNF